MFGFFRKKKIIKAPIPEESQKWMIDAFKWLLVEFGKEKIISRSTLCPTEQDFPYKFVQSEKDAFALLPIIAGQMEIDPSKIELSFYDQSLMEFTAGSGGRLFSQQDSKTQYSSGTFRKKANKFQIELEISQFKDTENLIATLAHELSHVKLLGEKRIQKNDELLTDLTTVIYGLGIFCANASFKFYTGFDSWGYNKQGYLSQQEWGFALALLSYLKGEHMPAWIDHLSPNIKSDYINS
jgi:hypothetical protein